MRSIWKGPYQYLKQNKTKFTKIVSSCSVYSHQLETCILLSFGPLTLRLRYRRPTPKGVYPLNTVTFTKRLTFNILILTFRRGTQKFNQQLNDINLTINKWNSKKAGARQVTGPFLPSHINNKGQSLYDKKEEFIWIQNLCKRFNKGRISNK